jgi:hypothetical protein
MINFGGAYLQKEMKGVLGFIVRDRKGSQVTTGAGRISVLHHALSDACQVVLTSTCRTDRDMSHTQQFQLVDHWIDHACLD